MGKVKFTLNAFEIYGKDGIAYVRVDIETDKGATNYDEMLMKNNKADMELVKAIEVFLDLKMERQSIK